MAEATNTGLGSQMSGLLSDPSQLNDLMGNPLFTMGMGLLSASRDKKIDPFQAAMGGLSQSGAYSANKQQRDKERAQQEKMDELGKLLAEMIGQQGGPPAMGTSAAGTPMTPGALTGGVEPTQPKWQNPASQDLWTQLGWSDVIGR